MNIAISEAKQSLREGNHGVGAVIVKNDRILAQAHDSEEFNRDPTAHAEIIAIRKACVLAGKDLSGCILLVTRAPCPMCMKAISEAHFARLIYGCDPAEGSADSNFHNAGAALRVEKGLLKEECSVLYHPEVRSELIRLRGATEKQLIEYNQQSMNRRLEWYRREKRNLRLGAGDVAQRGYRLLLMKLGVGEKEAPVVRRSKGVVVFHSKNFCPTLEACQILGLDTRWVCRLSNEGSADQLIRQIDPRLRFSRNYELIRPYSGYCEERIEFS
jgi:tRNA(Arg) A34 adenosine deaminase TadA